ncbi:MAG: hypothetical protein HY961_05300 [Ignavibacteriae bacterium]|nr:hypothetical protein [Ignavibacteriota bacterium]
MAQVPLMKSPRMNSTQGTIISTLPNNSVTHLVTQSSTVYVGTSKGVARTSNGGLTWESFRGDPAFVKESIFSLGVRNNFIWAATGYSKPIEDNKTVQTGTGYAYSTNSGQTWAHANQPLDAANDSIVQYGSNRINFLPIIVPEQNVTFDLAVTDTTVWVASWSSGLRKSTNRGQTWIRTVLPSDSRNSIAPSDALAGYVMDPRRNNNFLAFSVYVENDSTIWGGTAGGINKSTDGGVSWTKFSSGNQVSHILGNWVISISGQRFANRTRIWCTNWRADDASDPGPDEQYGVSFSDDGGRIWKNALHGVKAYDFAFKDSVVYVASEEGVFRSSDNGESWTQTGTIIDNKSSQRLFTKQFYSVGVVADTVYCGSGEGLAKTVDNATTPFGATWQILRTYRPVGNTSATYVYPNPFSPKQEIARVHYGTGGKDASVTIELFDFGMNRVRTIIKDAQRSGTAEHDEFWDGLDDNKRQVANGVYFYRVIVSDGDPSWGKVMVLQ